MNKKGSKAQAYENNLNDIYSGMRNEDVEESLIYLTNPSRGKHCSLKTLRTVIKAGEVGELIHKFDPIMFYTGMNEQ
jgi:hypothetical protein